MEHRLAAVLAADMVGYSRLMEADERGTLARLRTHRIELIDPAIAKNQGRLIKTTGDIYGDGVNEADVAHLRDGLVRAGMTA